MYSIGRVPPSIRSFFTSTRDQFSKPARRHFNGLVLAFALASQEVMTNESFADLKGCWRHENGQFELSYLFHQFG